MKTVKTILVFKTSVSQTEEIKELQQTLDGLVNSHGKWNFDLEDCDNILRVETWNLEASRVAAILNTKGFYCEEL